MIEPRDWYYCPICGKLYRWDNEQQTYIQACNCVWIEETNSDENPETTTTATRANALSRLLR